MSETLVVVEPNGTGGMIHFAYQLCNAMAGIDCKVILITSSDYEMLDRPHDFVVDTRMRMWSLTDQTQADTNSIVGRTYRRVWRKLRRVMRGMILLREWSRLTLHLLSMKPCIVQFGAIHFPFQSIFLWILRRRGLKLTQICHEFEERDKRRPFLGQMLGRLSQATYSNFEMIFFLSEDTRTTFLRSFERPKEKTAVVKMGQQDIFDDDPQIGERLRAKYKLNGSHPVILFFGTLRPSKGVDVLVQAFSMVYRSTTAKLLIVGYPAKHMDMGALENSIEALGLQDSVVLDMRYVPMEEVGAIQTLADVVAYPYRNATQSGALYLAYQFSRPVVASAVGGLVEDVQHEITGLLVPPEKPKELAAALIRLIENPDLAKKLGTQGCDFAKQQHSWPEIAQDILQQYATIGLVKAETSAR